MWKLIPLLFAASTASAEKCAPRPDIVARLQGRYTEAQVGYGLLGDSQALEVWVSEETGSFTILLTLPNGLSCLVAAGDNWNAVDPVTGEPT